MASAGSSRARVRVDGKFFRLGAGKFHVKGVAYGPFAPNSAGQPFAPPEETALDFERIRELGANVLRVYHVPGRWFLDLAEQNGLKVLVDIPWNKHLCFLESAATRAEARETVRRAVNLCARHPAVFAYSVANEVPADIVRWSGSQPVARFLDELVQETKQLDPDSLCTFANFPPTEYLRPQTLDFLSFNVYLHNEPAFRSYLSRLQMVADGKPLVLTECGMDSLREGEAQQAEFLGWQIEDSFRAGLAGVVVFSYTDDWWRDGKIVQNWRFGLTDVERRPKPAFDVVREKFAAAPDFPLPRVPKVSVVVASYNGERTLKACLDSLERLHYPDYEVILVDDGSTDTTPSIAKQHPSVRCFRHERNLGLSVARNTGISAATGEIIAFTDSDCRADEDWLYYLVGDLLNSEFAGMGGPNLLPPEDSPVAGAVMVSPGGPVHVMLTDRRAEHIPGCNMAFYRKVLLELGGFDPIFTRAGDDVDVCWRLQQAGHRIGFSPSAYVWHYRRSNLGSYLFQQHGYGEAEALLVRKHPEYFNDLGGSLWRGRIYTTSKFGVLVRRPIIYRGLFGSAGFQFLYAAEPHAPLMLGTTLEYQVLVTLPLWVLTVTWHGLWPLAAASLLISVGVCAAAGLQAALPREQARWWSRPLVATLYFLQPIVRGWARYQGRLRLRPMPAGQVTLDSEALRGSGRDLGEAQYWSPTPINRFTLVADLLRRLDAQGWPNKSDAGWSEYDLEVYGSRWSQVQLTTVAEDHSDGRQLLRCRLRARWSLQAKVAFWTLAGFELLVIGFVGTWLRWLWLVLLTLPFLAWFLRRERRHLQSLIAVFLDEAAKTWGMTKVRPGESESPTPESPASEKIQIRGSKAPA